ncbi:MAG: hypothetical protein HYS89_00740 [Candidatus Colwellbacteria bacterium]|nr:hypothetical protein [Candidatus Colwellbacteria bacterium]
MSTIKPKINYAFLCDYAFISGGDKLNIIGIFKNINTQNLPAQHPLMFVVTSIAVATKGNFKVNIKFVRRLDNVEIIPPLDFDISMVSDEGSREGELGVIGQIANLKFEEAGMYDVLVLVNGENIGSLPLQVLHLKKNAAK